MPTSRRTRTIDAAPQRVWEVVEDPHHLPRWWPGVKRMESVAPESWTEVHMTKKGRPVRIDFRLLESEPPWRRSWEQEVVGTPFERVLNAAVTEIVLEPAESGTKVRLALKQNLRGYSRIGAVMLRRATGVKLDEALEGLARIC
ncbi:MAG: SRPBCC family protein [Solirubrobacteraceae bacterium]